MSQSNLARLLAGIHQGLPIDKNITITGLTLDSRAVKSGDLFIAIRGTQTDGTQFISDALAHGANAVLVADESLATDRIFYIPHLKEYIHEIAARFYDHPMQSMQIVGITGTNGKTSCSHFIAAALHHLGLPCGVIGTLGNGVYGQIEQGALTTPDAITLQKLFADFHQQGVKYVAMEVSSHSIDQGRIAGIPFAVGVFTNLTRDHLDYHGTMEAYGAAKKKLFINPLLESAVINADDEFGQVILKSLRTRKSVYGYGVKASCDIIASDIQLDLEGLKASVKTPWGQGQLRAPLIGHFNISNLLATLATLCLLDVPFHDALASLSHLHSVPGRMQAQGGGKKPLVIVDYSHTPDSLEKALIALRKHCQGRLVCLFGCGGDRDRGKRPLMASIAEQYADHVIVTDDNPRTEDPGQIMADIMQGFSKPNAVILQHDRSKAIEYAIQYAKSGDCILVAGKGAETYQQIGHEKLPFSDVDKVTQFLGES